MRSTVLRYRGVYQQKEMESNRIEIGLDHIDW